MTMLRLLETTDWIVDYDTQNSRYRVSYFENNNFIDECWFDAYTDKFSEYEKLDELGLLLKLQLKVGDTFWELNDNFVEPAIYPRKAHSLQHVLYCMDRLGKVTFLTEDEAKQYLAKILEETNGK